MSTPRLSAQPATELPSPEFHSLGRLLFARATQAPERTAFTFLENGEGVRSCSYRELDGRARAIAADLLQVCKPGDRALLVYEAGLEFVSAFFACMYAGVIAVPVAVPEHRRIAPVFLSIAHDAQPRVVLTANAALDGVLPSLRDEMPQSVAFLPTDSIASFTGPGADWGLGDIHESAVAYLQYTSGSTSKPRGVMVTHGNAFNNLRAIDADFKHDEHSISLTWLPHFHDMGLVYGVLQPVFNGFPCLILSPSTFSRQPILWLQSISKYRVTHSGGPNFAYDLCAKKIEPDQKAAIDLSSWRVAFNGAEPIHAETLHRFADTFAPCGFRRESLYMAYGLAEATLKVSGRFYNSQAESVDVVETAGLSKGQAIRGPGDTQPVTSVVSCGAAALDTEMQIIDPESGDVCNDNRIGEVWAKGPGIAAGYWGRAEDTEAVFGGRIAGDKGGFLRTGDLGYRFRGEIFLVGRLKDLIIVHGRNFYPHDIEATIAKVMGQAAKGLTAVFSAPVDSRERVVLVQEVAHRLEDFGPLAGEMLSAVAQAHDLAIDVLAFVRFGKIPRTTSGKVRRRAVRELFLENALEPIWQRSAQERAAEWPVVAPRTPLETGIHGIWCEVLTREVVGINDRFLDVGGDSVLAAQIAARLSAAFGLDVPVKSVFEYQTIAALAERVQELLAERTQELEAAKALRCRQLEENKNLLEKIDQLSPEELDLHLNRLYGNDVASDASGQSEQLSLGKAE
ncbi:MAG TPA: AMP-binding protein [Candidatus Angelobacter sp.]|nr:AMP-binding protein [Candidatus Angelobacter sp.]